MCGIAGLIGRPSDATREALRRMAGALAHRGPDGEGFWEGPPDALGWAPMLAHRRLSIIDLSDAAAQPMVDPRDGGVLVFNGEIYNHQALRAELRRQGHELASSGDTAVALRTLGVQGPAAVESWRGMFAFAHWQPGSGRLTLARDPLGIKPLYVAHNPDPRGDWTIAFASELRALLGSGLLRTPQLNPRAAASVAWNGFVVSPDTAITGIELVWPGEWRVYDGHGLELKRHQYWHLPPGDSGPPIGEEEFAQVLEESVRAHLTADVPVAVFLSGGIDSSALANLAQRATGEPVDTFTLAFDEAEYSEAAYARRVSSAIGTRHHEFVLTESHFLAHLDTALDSLDQPTFDGLNSFYMAQAVRDAGFKAVLSGSGGDELFGGYTSFRDLPHFQRWAARGRWLPLPLRVGLARALAALLQPTRGAVPQQTRWAKLPEMVRGGEDLLHVYQLAYALFLPDFQRQLLGDGVGTSRDLAHGLPPAMRMRLLREMASRSPLAAISVMEQRMYLGERLLRDTDAASMAASVEVRLPLVDHRLVQAVDRLPSRLRYEPVPSKALLRRIGLRGLDPALFSRPKSGFVLPYDRWLRAGLGRRIDAVMRDPVIIRPTGLDAGAVTRLWQAFLDRAPGLYWSRVWALFVYIRWCHRQRAFI
jgi:asparagine synthase (glutamine-hydrolysing)